MARKGVVLAKGSASDTVHILRVPVNRHGGMSDAGRKAVTDAVGTGSWRIIMLENLLEVNDGIRHSVWQVLTQRLNSVQAREEDYA